MFLQNSLQILILWTAFLFQDVVGTCERPDWTNVGWEMTPQDLMKLSEEQSSGIHSSVCQICHQLTGIELSKECLQVLNASCKVALFIMVILSFLYLLPKLKLAARRKGMIQAPVFSAPMKMTTEYSPNTEQLLFRLVANTSKMMKYMKHVAHHYRKETRRHKSSKKKKAEDTDDEQLFPIYSHRYSSSEDSAMHGI